MEIASLNFEISFTFRRFTIFQNEVEVNLCIPNTLRNRLKDRFRQVFGVPMCVLYENVYLFRARK